MIPVSVEEIRKATGGTLLSGDASGLVSNITTDSRKAEKGTLFVAISGEHADGHDFLQKAKENGALCALVEKEVTVTESNTFSVILVSETVRAMGQIAKMLMQKRNIPKIAITGSVGKTTTRDMTYAVLSQKFKTLKNENNFNNEIGVPLTVFRAEPSTEAAVIEMGMDHFGEIERLSHMIEPSVAIITNIGMSHIENLGSQENIYKAKSELFQHTKQDGVVILNGDDPILMAHKNEISQKVITVGVKNTDADLTATDIVSDEKGVTFSVSGMGTKGKITLPVPGEHNVLNALLAFAAGLHFGVSAEEGISALEQFSLEKMRMDILTLSHITVINDCYNAAPASVKAALSVLSKYENRKVAVLGDIAALGEYSYNAHRDLGTDVVKCGIDILLTVGENARFIAEGAFENGMDSVNILSVDTVEELYPHLRTVIKENDVVLVKASRVMGLERVTEFLKQQF